MPLTSERTLFRNFFAFSKCSRIANAAFSGSLPLIASTMRSCSSMAAISRRCTISEPITFVVFAFLAFLTIIDTTSGQYAQSGDEPLYGSWISPRWDTPPKGTFIPNEGFGKIVFSAEYVLFYRKSSDNKDVGEDRYKILEKNTDKDNIPLYLVLCQNSIQWNLLVW